MTHFQWVRKEVTWLIQDFKTESLNDGDFRALPSSKFQFYLGGEARKLSLRLERNRSSLGIFLDSDGSTGRVSVAFEVGLLDQYGFSSHIKKGKLVNAFYGEKLCRLINYKELVAFQNKNFHNPIFKKNLTIVANLVFIDPPKVFNVPRTVSQQFEKLFNNEERSDFVLVSSDGLEIPVHKIILSARSQVFETMMEGDFKEKQEKKAVLEGLSGKALTELLRFVYCGRVEQVDEIAVELLNAAIQYEILDLKPICVKSLVSKLSVANVIETMILAELHGENYLKRFCIDFVKWKFNEVKNSEGWKEVTKELFKEILDVVLEVSRLSLMDNPILLTLDDAKINLTSML